jgi:hypothetical protein
MTTISGNPIVGYTEDSNQNEEAGQLRLENHLMKKAILSVPALLVYGNWDYKRCLFCGGKRKHENGCIRDKLEKEK